MNCPFKASGRNEDGDDVRLCDEENCALWREISRNSGVCVFQTLYSIMIDLNEIRHTL